MFHYPRSDNEDPVPISNREKLTRVFSISRHVNLARYLQYMGFPGGSVIKNLPVNAGNTSDMDTAPELGRSLGGRNGNPLQYSCLGNHGQRSLVGVVHGVAKQLDMTSTTKQQQLAIYSMSTLVSII